MSRNPSPRRSLKATAPGFLQPLSIKEEGGIRTLECRVDGYPRPEIHWEKSGRIIGKSRRIHMTRTGDRCLLEIKMPQTEDNGLYSCVATNIVGTASIQAKVSAPYLIQRRITGTSPRISSKQTTNGFCFQIKERPTLDLTIEGVSVNNNINHSMFRKRSQSGGSKSRKDKLSLPSKTKQPTFTSHLQQNSNDYLPNSVRKMGDDENIISSDKKRLCKSMEDCRKVKRNIFNRVKIPEIFNSSQNVENKTTSLRVSVLQPSQKVNGVLNRNNSVPSPQMVKRDQNPNKINTLTSSVSIETPAPLTTRERIAAYLKRFEASNSTKAKETLPDESYKKKSNSKNKEYHSKNIKTPTAEDNDTKFFSFAKFKRRKSNADNKKHNLDQYPNKSALVDEIENNVLKNSFPEHIDKEPSTNHSEGINNSVFIKQNSDAVENSNEKERLQNCEEQCARNNSVLTIPISHSQAEIDLNDLTFDEIDVSILDELNSFRNLSNESINMKIKSEDNAEELKSKISLGEGEGSEIKDFDVPQIYVQFSSEDNEEDIDHQIGIDENVKNYKDISSYYNESSTEDDTTINKKDTEILSPTAKKECEILFSNEEVQTPEILDSDLQNNVSPDESPARIVKGPQSVTVLRGESVTLAISFTGYPPPQVIWMKGGRILRSNGRLSILDGREMSVVTVNEVTADDSGKYVVSVNNDGGSDSCFASVAVVGIPEPPGGEPTASEITDHSLVLSWYGSMYDGGSVVTGYQVEMCTLPSKTWHKVTSSVNTSCTVQGLSKGQRYVFRVRAENRYGLSHPSKESKIIRLDDFLIETSSDEEIVEEKLTTITVDNGTEFSDRFDLKEEVGKGRFGTVYRCVEKSSGRPRAAKIIRCLKMKDKEKVKQEIEIMSRLHHPKLMQVLAAFESGRNMIMVMEYISGGELFERVIADDFVLTEQDCVLFMRQICDGVAYMHKNNILHLDLKPENILCKTRTSHKIKIIDFGLARFYNEEESLRILFGTPEFVAPEVINYEPVCPASDMWSVGVICYVLISGLSPFMGDSDTETFANITRGEMDFDDEAFDDISEDAKDFISKLLVKKLKARMSAEECLKHSWLATASSVQKRPLSTEKLKRFIIRRKWQKSGTAIRALGRMVTLSRSSMGSSCDSPIGSPRSSRSGSSLLSRSETAESGESDVFQDLSR